MLEEVQKETNPAAGMLVHGAVCVVAGAVTLGVGSGLFGVSAEYNHIATMFSKGNAGMSSLGMDLLFYSVIAGAGILAFGIFGIVNNLVLKSRFLAAATLFLIFLLSVVQIAGAVLYGNTVSNAFSVLEPDALTTEFSDEQTGILDTSLAVFNMCCRPYVNDTRMLTEWVADAQGDAVSCPERSSVPGCNLPSLITVDFATLGLDKLLCTCYKETVYAPITNYINANDVCAALEATKVPVHEVKLKVPEVDVELESLLKSAPGRNYDQYLPLVEFAMTGFPGPEYADIGASGVLTRNLTAQELASAPVKQGLNCGVGYAKGVAWQQWLWLDQTGSLVVIILYVAAALQLVGSILVVMFWFVGGESNEEWMDYESQQVAPGKEKF